MRSAIQTVVSTIHYELIHTHFYLYPRERAKVFIGVAEDWAAALGKFKEARDDVFAGVDCWAMGQATASVFHMMRVVEKGLGHLASEVGLTLAHENWGTIIDLIEKNIANERNSLPKGSQRNERLQFLSEAAIEMRYFKDAWRNYVSHGRGAYDEHNARGIIEHVRAFMTRLSA